MRNFKMFCLTLDPDHYGFIKKLGYTPVGLGEKHFNENWFTDRSGMNISSKNKSKKIRDLLQKISQNKKLFLT